jgi:hypothetical protein
MGSRSIAFKRNMQFPPIRARPFAEELSTEYKLDIRTGGADFKARIGQRSLEKVPSVSAKYFAARVNGGDYVVAQN